MRAVVYDRYGPPEVLRLIDRPAPEAGPGEVLIAVAASGVNPGEWRLRSGQFRFGMRLKLPFVPGSDVAGTVAAVGRDVTAFGIGDPVYAMTPLKTGGGCADYVAVAANLVAKAPPGLSLTDAAALPLAGLTALQSLRDAAGLQRGQRLAVIGASGGVGHLAVQVGRALGAQVSAVCGPRSFDFVRSLGAQAAHDYADEATYAPLDRYDVVLDAVAKAPIIRWSRMLRPGGSVVTLNTVIGRVLPSFVTRLLGVPHLRSVFVKPSGADLDALAALVGTGAVRPHVERRFPLADVADAHRLSAAGHVNGKLVIDVAGDAATRATR